MLRNLVPGSHLLLIWDVPGFILFVSKAQLVLRGGRAAMDHYACRASALRLGRASALSPPGLPRAPV